MTPTDLLRGVQTYGGAIWADGDRLELEVPDDFPDTLIEALKQRKAEVLALLRRRTEPANSPDYAATACVCPVPVGPTGDARCPVCHLPLICPHCGRCRGCKLAIEFPPGRGSYG
jgi:hypothetical protein